MAASCCITLRRAQCLTHSAALCASLVGSLCARAETFAVIFLHDILFAAEQRRHRRKQAASTHTRLICCIFGQTGLRACACVLCASVCTMARVHEHAHTQTHISRSANTPDGVWCGHGFAGSTRAHWHVHSQIRLCCVRAGRNKVTGMLCEVVHAHAV